MKHIRLILLGALTLAFISGNAQIKIEKRKHLKGYSIERIGRTSHVNDMKISDGERITAADVAKMDEAVVVEESNVVVHPVATSAFITPAAVAAPVIAQRTVPAQKSEIAKGWSFRRGAGLVLDHKLTSISKKTKKTLLPASIAVQPTDIFAYLGFIFGILSILAIFGSGLIVFGIIGLIFSLLGMDSGAGQYAKWGLILSIVGLIIGIVVFAAYIAT